MAINYVNRTHYECDQCGVDEEFDEGDVADGLLVHPENQQRELQG